MAQSQSWKVQERSMARMLGAERNPNIGLGQSDFDVPGFSFESKKRKALPALLTAAFAQAVRNCKPGRKPAVAFVLAPSSGVKVQRFALLRFEDFVELHQRAYPGEGVVDAGDTMAGPEGS
jgi:hypothetical protein